MRFQAKYGREADFHVFAEGERFSWWPSSTDRGRVLAITTLADLDDYRPWGNRWQAALQTIFPDNWREFAFRTGHGIRLLLNSEEDLEEAHHSCINGLLSSQQTTLGALRAAGERLIGDAIERLESLARQS